MNTIAVALAGSIVLTGFQLVAPYLDRMPPRYRAFLASLSAGAGLAYVFLYLLFELATEGAPKIHALLPLGPEPLESLLILLLIAFSATYVVQSRLERTPDRWDDHRGLALLFLTYNLLAGAGLLEESTWGILNLAFYVVAIGLHLLLNERFLLHLFPETHTRGWRCALAIAPILGCAFALALDLPDAVLYLILALVAGGTLNTVLRRELPDAPNLRLPAFLIGIVAYGCLIFATWRF